MAQIGLLRPAKHRPGHKLERNIFISLCCSHSAVVQRFAMAERSLRCRGWRTPLYPTQTVPSSALPVRDGFSSALWWLLPRKGHRVFRPEELPAASFTRIKGTWHQSPQCLSLGCGDKSDTASFCLYHPFPQPPASLNPSGALSERAPPQPKGLHLTPRHGESSLRMSKVVPRAPQTEEFPRFYRINALGRITGDYCSLRCFHMAGNNAPGIHNN